MSNDLENDLAAALRFRAGEVPDTPCPPLTGAPAPQRGWLVPVTAAAAAVAGLVAAGIVLVPGSGGQQDVTVAAESEVYYSRVVIGVPGEQLTEIELWQGQARTDEWLQEGVGGRVLADGRVVPDESVVVAVDGSGACYPAETVSAPECTAPGSWFNPTPEFLAGAPRDPEVIKRQLRAEAITEEKRPAGSGGGFTAGDGTFSEENLDYLQLAHLKELLTGNGVPEDLEAALQQVVTEQFPTIRITPGTANLLGVKGIGYSLPAHRGGPLTVIFDAEGDYLGAPEQAVVHGFAPALGEPPSRLID